jgi:hypothetical protein
MVEPDARHRKPPPRLPMTLTSALEHVAGMIDRLDAALAFHPLLGAALGVRARLDRGMSGRRCAPPSHYMGSIWAAAPGDRPALPAVDRCRST